MSNHIETVREWFALVERKDNQAIGERLIGEGYTATDHTTDVVATTQEQLEAAMVEDSQWSDRKYVIKEAMETTDGAVIVLLDITDTLTGQWRGIKGTGQKVHREMCDIFRFDADGRVISEEMYEDALSIMRQLRAVGDSPESVVRRFFVAWEDPTADGLVSFYSPDAVYTSGPGATLHGIDAIRANYQRQLGRGFAGFRIEVKKIVADGATVIAERVDSFTLGGTTFEIEAVGVFEIDDDGRIKRFRDYYDLQSITDQMEAAGFEVRD